MAGVIRGGRHAGGRAYGYRAVPGKPGELEIVEDEAAIVRRIFAAYVARDERPGTSHTILTEKVFVHREAGDGTPRRSMATPNAVPG